MHKRENREQPLLELREVSKQFGGIHAVEDFSLTVRPGDLHCLIGPNGAGKTTIFKLVTGIYPPSAGKILFQGKDITRLPSFRRMRGGISIKMQIPGVFEGLTLRENLRIAMQNFVPARRMAEEMDRLIAMLKLEELGNPLVKNLSHGQQQWLEIAMALASKPKLLLLDEPAAGMGTEETRFTARLIKRLHEQSIAIFFIDHDMDFVSELAKTITVLHFGKKFAEGTVEEIKSNEGVKQIYLGNV